MITTERMLFPQNAVMLIADAADNIDIDVPAFRRPLRESDPVQCIGVFGAQWLPDENSHEMRGGNPGPQEPTLSQYIIGVQALVKDADEARGLAVHSVLAKLVRTMLYRDPNLRVGLSELVAEQGGSTERARRWGVRTQHLMSNELRGTWTYASTLEFWLETETI